MIEDTRLFSANNPIGRLWYYINIVILALLTIGVHIGINEYILPSVNESYRLPITIILIFAYIFFIITFFMLIDRRLYDIFGSRDAQGYTIISKITGLFVLSVVLAVIAFFTGFHLEVFYRVFEICACVFAILVFILGLIPGKAK